MKAGNLNCRSWTRWSDAHLSTVTAAEGEGRDHDLAGEAGGADGQLEPHGAVADRHAVLDTEQPRQARLELAHVGAVVGEPAAVQHVAEPREEAAPIPETRAPHVERLGEGGSAAEDRQLVEAGLLRHGEAARGGRRRRALPWRHP
jgi:hypothetical protein